MTLSAKEQQRSAVVSRWLAGIVTTGEAVALLGVSERTAWRLRTAMVRDGAAGLAHRNRDQRRDSRYLYVLDPVSAQTGDASILSPGSPLAACRITPG